MLLVAMTELQARIILHHNFYYVGNGRRSLHVVFDQSSWLELHCLTAYSNFSEPHFVAVGPPDVDGFSDVVAAIDLLARYLGDGLFARAQPRGYMNAVAEENRARYGGGHRCVAVHGAGS